MVKEVLAGNGVGPNKDHVLLKLDHLGEEVLHSRLPGICELSRPSPTSTRSLRRSR